MWLPLTSRGRWRWFSPARAFSTSATHGPAAFTRARAVTVCRAPVAWSSRVARQRPSWRRAATQRVRARMSAPAPARPPRSAPPGGNRPPSNRNTRTRCGTARCSGRPSGTRRRSRRCVPGRLRRPPRWSYRNSPRRTIQAGRCSREWGSTKRIGQTMCGAMPQQHLALAQRLPHQAELVVFQVAQPAMDQLAGGGGGGAGQVALLAQQHATGRGRRRPGRCRAVDAAADDQQVDDCSHAEPSLLPQPAVRRATVAG